MPNTPRPNTPRNTKGQSKEEAIEEILRRVEERLRRELIVGGQTLDQIEEQSKALAKKSNVLAKRSGGAGTL